jgi:hypothetical protein
MDWFERLTGFREADYDDTRAKLKVEGTRLQSLINGKSYGIGELELVPLQALRERVKSAGGLPGRLKVSVVTGDVRQMHQSPENAGALFQVACLIAARSTRGDSSGSSVVAAKRSRQIKMIRRTASHYSFL